jgi:hypothetical protein
VRNESAPSQTLRRPPKFYFLGLTPSIPHRVFPTQHLSMVLAASRSCLYRMLEI